MRIRIPYLLLVLSSFGMAEDDTAVVRFSNGDQLTGEVLALSGDQLSWQSQILKEPSDFELGHIVDLNMSPGDDDAEPPPGAAHKAVLELYNGDLIEGQLSGLSDDDIQLRTSYAGELTVRRVNVKSVKISRTSDYFYRGPNSIEEWTVTKGNSSWQFRGGALHSKSPGGIAREVGFPDECVISFDAAWRGSFRPKVIFFSDAISSDSPDAGYEMVFQGNSVHVKKCGTNNWLGHSTNAGSLRENEKARIEIKASRKTGKILLYVDGEIIDVWEDGDIDAEKLGNGLHIISQDSSPLRISNIAVTSWDGYYEDVPNRQAGFRGRVFRGGFQGQEQAEDDKESKNKLPAGRMVLLNGDNIEGEVLKIEGEDITLKTPFTEVIFPIARLKNIVLSPTEMETPRRYKGDVRATLADGSRLVFRFDGVDGDKLVGFSQHFGEARFSKDAFRRIEFNIYNEAMEAMRLRDDW